MKKIKSIALMAIVAFTITSCNKNDAPTVESLELQSETAILSSDCTFADTVVRVYRTATPSSTYGNWAPVDFTLDGVVPLRLEGIYGSFFRPQEASFDNWYIGRLDSTTVCSPWLDLAIDVKNAYVGSHPSSNPYNVLGYDDGTLLGYNFDIGYYYYDLVTHVMSPSYAIAVWKDANGSGDYEYVSTPSNASIAYIIKVQSITFGTDATGYYSDISFKYGQAK
ncbi:hypothetical protein [Sphingobacterium sp. LRF_L2]|uniref:hypothetical protein n=1 Tax=Sphingobacterium sp. LRF_L2 TaxID=3369421 RepID=UPI003F61A740